MLRSSFFTHRFLVTLRCIIHSLFATPQSYLFTHRSSVTLRCAPRSSVTGSSVFSDELLARSFTLHSLFIGPQWQSKKPRPSKRYKIESAATARHRDIRVGARRGRYSTCYGAQTGALVGHGCNVSLWCSTLIFWLLPMAFF